MRNIFLDKALEREFEQKGFVVVDLIPADEVAAFVELYDTLEGAKGTANTNKNTYELSFFEKDIASKKRKFNSMYEFLQPHINKVLDRYSPIIVNLFNKEHGTGEVPVHQNWTFVDESKFTSVSVWCPLQSVSRQNGTLEVVPGTHRVISDYRGPSIPWVFDELNNIMMEKYMLPLELSPGQVAIIDDSVIHYSGINHTHHNRKAVQFIMKPEEAQLIHCYKADKETDEISIIDVDDDYFFDFDMWEKPKGGRNLRTIHFPIRKISEPELVRMTERNLQNEFGLK